MRGPSEIVPLRASCPPDRAGRPAPVLPSPTRMQAQPLRGLTLEDFEALLARLAPDRERAGALYVDLRCRLVRLFARRLDGDAESLADEVIDRVARQLAEGKEIYTERPFGYFRSVARHVAQEMLRKRQAFYAQPAIFHHHEPEPHVDPRFTCLQVCLGHLPADQRRLILRYYGEDDRTSNRQHLAQELGIGGNALRIRVHRARRKLEACCARCLAMEVSTSRRGGAAPVGGPKAGDRGSPTLACREETLCSFASPRDRRGFLPALPGKAVIA